MHWARCKNRLGAAEGESQGNNIKLKELIVALIYFLQASDANARENRIAKPHREYV